MVLFHPTTRVAYRNVYVTPKGTQRVSAVSWLTREEADEVAGVVLERRRDRRILLLRLTFKEDR
jgi:hypothetical protein